MNTNTNLQNTNINSGLGDSYLNYLSDVTLEISPDSINEICSKWEASISSIDLSSIDIETVFSSLINFGIGASYFSSLKNAFSKAENMILSISNVIKSTANEQSGTDQQYQRRNYSSGGSSGNDGSKESVPATLPVEVDTSVNNADKNLKINKNFTEKINKLDTDSYIKFMTALGSISGGNLLDLVMDDKYAQELKRRLLQSPDIDADLRQIISEMDENELQTTLQSILTDKKMMSDTTKNIIYTYTESLSQNSNIDILKVSKEIQFFNDVDNLLNTTKSLIDSQNMNENIMAIYDGDIATNSISESAVSFIRTAVDVISEKNNLSYEDLLMSDSNNNLVKTEFSNLSKALSYFRTVNTMGTEASQIIYNNIIKEK